ncbi:hypothetical protein F4861DRAFT_500310 [Xylaria intraflava]|nr:hypothetical protein F4861DRAFT_500310 [Xylaria intraflava]
MSTQWVLFVAFPISQYPTLPRIRTMGDRGVRWMVFYFIFISFGQSDGIVWDYSAWSFCLAAFTGKGYFVWTWVLCR